MANTDKGSDSSPSQGHDPGIQNSDGWQRLVSEYLGDLPRQLNSVREILEIPNYEKIKQQAHRIKGTSGTYGLETISKNAAQLEQSADTHDSGNVARAINNITRSVEIETIRLNSQSAVASDSPEGTANG